MDDTQRTTGEAEAVKPIAARIIEKCGGTVRTAELSERSLSAVYRWTYPKSRGGLGGAVPRDAQEKLLAAANTGAVDLEPADFFEIGK